MQTWLPRSWLLAVGGAPTASILALMLLAVVVSVCSSVDAFLTWPHAQVTPGALLAFLLLGPVVDLKLAGLFTVLMRPRAIAITSITAGLGVLLIGQWVNRGGYEQGMVMRQSLLLILWGVMVLWSLQSGRLDHAAAGVFHGLVGVEYLGGDRGVAAAATRTTSNAGTGLVPAA